MAEYTISNEKYNGDSRLKKCCTVDYLSKKRKENEWEMPQYYVEGGYDAIIKLTEWQFVQTEM